MALRALLSTLAAWELQAKLDAEGVAGDENGSPATAAARLACGEALARVHADLAALKATFASAPRFISVAVGDYLVLAASPLTRRSAAALGAVAAAARRGSGNSAAAAAAAASGPMTSATAAAVREGAYAMYGACPAAELQALHSGLGGGEGGAWRAALTVLREDCARHFKYTGKV
jgi:hypothetical protein